jgi:hypothetical protein
MLMKLCRGKRGDGAFDLLFVFARLNVLSSPPAYQAWTGLEKE